MNPFTPPAAPIDPTLPSQLASTLSVSFRNSLLDQMLFQTYVQLRSFFYWTYVLALAAFLALLMWDDGLPTFVFALVVFALAILLAQSAFTFLWVLIHRDRNFYRPRVLEVSARSIVDTTDFSRYEMQWPAVDGVFRTPWCLYIRLSPGSAHCIPPRAFPNADAYVRYADAAVSFFKQSRKAPS